MGAEHLPEQVTLVEVGPRDGLQNEKKVSTATKIQLINDLSETGLTHIESGSFVSPKWIPQMADSAKVLQRISRKPDITYSALVPNLNGLEAAIAASVTQIAIFTSASESFCRKNINCSIKESLQRFEPIMKLAQQHNIKVRGYLSCITDCPYEGKTSVTQVSKVAQSLYQLGCYEISLGDTLGMASPVRIEQVLEAIQMNVPAEHLAIHCHDTYGQALVNIYQALQCGVSVVDCSVGGLGGCPYAPGANGNVATEDVLYLCRGLGIKTGVDLEKVAAIGKDISQKLNRIPSSKVNLSLMLSA